MSKPPPPPPPKSKAEARVHPRYELFASVELVVQDVTVVLPAKNVSLGGIYLGSDGNDLSSFKIGGEVEVMVFDALDEGQATVRAKAKVVRREKDGLALTWTTTDPVVAKKLATLLERLNPT